MGNMLQKDTQPAIAVSSFLLEHINSLMAKLPSNEAEAVKAPTHEMLAFLNGYKELYSNTLKELDSHHTAIGNSYSILKFNVLPTHH